MPNGSDEEAELTSVSSVSASLSAQPSPNLKVDGDIAATYAPSRLHSEVYFRGQDGHVHYFYVLENIWRHDSQSFNVAGSVGNLATVYESDRGSSALFVKGEDGFLHYFYVSPARVWLHDGASFRAAGKIS
jgi:hypothetical protein